MALSFISVLIYISIYLGLVATSFYILSYLDYRKKEKIFFPEEELPKVSVIIPAYNEEGSISRTIESILETDYSKDKFEVIVINNNSTDNTLEIAKRYEEKGVRVYTEKKQGKGAALNLGISKAKGEIIFTMDADTFVEPYSVKRMVRYFKNKDVAAVTPAMLTTKPKNLWERIQYMEYYLGIFLRKAFATMGAVYITPGAFSAYRKEFFEKHGGYDEDNITEDLEISLRIQYHGYLVENADDAPAYTMMPKKFKELLIQRRRWYVGHIKNIWEYRKLISREYGDLGMFVIPVGVLSIVFALAIFVYTIFSSFFNIVDEALFFSKFGLDFSGLLEINSFAIERLFFSLFTNDVFLFVLLFMALSGAYLLWTKKKVGKSYGIFFSLISFFSLFAILFSFWWIVSIFYVLFGKTVKWK